MFEFRLWQERHLFGALGVVLLAVVAARGEFGNDYWAPVDTSTQTTLATTVHELLRATHNRIPYSTSNWPVLEAADEHPGKPGFVLDIYKNSSIPLPAAGEQRPYDREHLWPQSRGFPEGGAWSTNPRADLHNLYICDRPYNNSRSNYFFDWVVSTDEFPTDFNNGVGGGSGVYPGNSNWRDNATTRWLVWPDRRGDVARGVLYMTLRYNGGNGADGSLEPDLRVTDNTSLSTTGAQAIAYMGLRSVLLEWHAQDPPDEKERHRHNVVAVAQRNRNPLIDHPGWADCLFSGNCSTVPPIHPQGLFTTVDAASVILRWDARIESDLAGYHVYRSTTSTEGFTRVNPATVTQTTYIDTPELPGVRYYYAVTAVDTAGNESLLSRTAHATPGDRALIRQEKFETTQGWSIAEGTGDFGNSFFGRFSLVPNTVPAQLTTSITGVVGNFFIAGANTSGTAANRENPLYNFPLDGIHRVVLDPIDVSRFHDLRVYIALNARNANVYDSVGQANGDYLQVWVSRDGGADVLVGQFTKMGPAGSNGKFGQDLNLNGLGDVEIQDYSRLEDYSFPVPTAGSDPASLTVKVVTRFDANGEEIVYDNIRVTGVPKLRPSDYWMIY